MQDSKGKDDKSVKEGSVLEAFKGGLFRVKIDGSDEEVQANLAGKMRLHYIRVLVGDRVQVEFTPYDKNRGRIIRRL
ncbi:MAG: translation initiation factor IF-1 [bacterium]|nr:translation initiation factor IF-1 [bacterium]